MPSSRFPYSKESPEQGQEEPPRGPGWGQVASLPRREPPRDLLRAIRGCFQGQAWGWAEQCLRGRRDSLLRGLLDANSHSDPVALGRLQGAIATLDYLLDGNLKADMVMLLGDPQGDKGVEPYTPRELTLEDMDAAR